MTAITTFEFLPSLTKTLPMDFGSFARIRSADSVLSVDLMSLQQPMTASEQFFHNHQLRNSESFRVSFNFQHSGILGELKSNEAPARLNTPTTSPKTSRKTTARSRASSLPDMSVNALQVDCSEDDNSEFMNLIDKANSGMKAGVPPTLAEGGLGGAYFVRDSKRVITVVCKPGDEEPNALNNPSLTGYSNKGAITPGFGMFREVVAATLDNGFCGVPPTKLGRLRHDLLRENKSGQNGWSVDSGSKTCSVQAYVRAECSAEDMGPSMYDTDDIHRIAVMDIRMCNLDRHEGNILVARTSPYQRDLTTIRRNRSSATLLFGSPQLDYSPSSSPQPFVVDNTIHVAASAPQSSMMSRQFDLGMSPRSSTPPRSTLTTPVTPNCNKSTLFRLVPIDHGYILPHVLRMSETSFAWLNWPQAHLPLSSEVKDYIANLDFNSDVKKIKATVGAALPESCLLTLQVGTIFLQLAVAAGLTLYDMGSAMTAPEDLSPVAASTRSPSTVSASRYSLNGATAPSRVQAAVNEAVQNTIAMEMVRSKSPNFLRETKSLKNEISVEEEIAQLSSTIPLSEEALQVALMLENGSLLSTQIKMSLGRLVDNLVTETCSLCDRIL